MARPSTKGPPRIFTPESARRARPLQFFQDVIAELKKVMWPSREETSRLTFIVIVISLAIGLILGVIDLAFTRVFTGFIVGGP